jgi:exopolyphosphatase/guanosine-5'-triphosphate,3'-diphosphate pyrophosphatase
MSKYIQERLEGPAARFSSKPIGRMIATSATASAAVCAVNHVRRARRDKADRLPASAPQIRQLFREVASKSLNGRSKITGMGPRRAEIITAGVAVLHEVMQGLRVPRLYYSAAGVRDGIIADLVHRRAGMEQARLDTEERQTVRVLGRRFEASVAHTRKVADLSAMLFEGLRDLHRLPLHRGRLLEAAAYLFNIGHFVNEAKHHRHSMYLVANSDLPGFSDAEHAIIANLCRYHRKSMPQPSHDLFVALTAEDRRAVLWLAPLLRLAVALDQSQEQRVERLEAAIHDDTVELRLYSTGDMDIEQWHAAQVADVFREVYGHALVVRAKR